jgi:NAD(P)-dependent dehydrogenase (short-subunit alcohol dehydrogenase family)
MQIKNSLAVVAGGGSGLGEAVSRHLAEQGAKVIVIDKSKAACERVANAIHGIPKTCDITIASDLEAVFAELAPTQPPLRIAVNCAGVSPAKRIVGKTGPVSLEWFEEIIKINLIGTFNVMRLAAHRMSQAEPNEEGERGVIINTASIAAFEGQIGQAAYSASKGGIVSMTLPAAREFARFGIRVMTIAPGFIETPMFQGFSHEVRANLEAQSVFPKRFGRPQEFELLVEQIINNPMLNGDVNRLDGAIRMSA